MRKASIVSIGNELLSGQTADTNVSYLGGRLISAGLPVVSAYTVPDDIDAIVRAVKLALDDSDIVIATGGLGPTEDDLTRQAIAKLLGVELELKEELLQQVEEFFKRRGVQMRQRNSIQAYMPAGTKPLGNDIGTAPGIIAKVGQKTFIALPGVPSEMKQMFEQRVLEQLKDFAAGQAVVVRKLRCFGAGESNIADLLGETLKRDRNPLINLTAQSGVITVTINAAASGRTEAHQLVEDDDKLLRGKLGELVFGAEEETLAEVVGKELARRKKTLAVAESCTGGTLAGLITDIPGASGYFTFGWVTYSNQAKNSQLGVPRQLLDKYGAVSEQVAEAMAQGARKRAGADIAIAITGIAGPGGANEQKPVGLVYISVDEDIGCVTERYILPGERGSIRLRASLTALNILRLKLQN